MPQFLILAVILSVFAHLSIHGAGVFDESKNFAAAWGWTLFAICLQIVALIFAVKFGASQ